MAKALSRAELFASLRGGPVGVRPPGAIVESQFVELCTRCDACLTACPERIIARGAGGFPILDVSSRGCTLCGDCVTACQEGCLAADGPLMVAAVAAVSAACLETTGTACRICAEHCGENALSFRPQLGGRSALIIDAETCTGCGACVAPCPVRALSLAPLPPLALARTEGRSA